MKRGKRVKANYIEFLEFGFLSNNLRERADQSCINKTIHDQQNQLPT